MSATAPAALVFRDAAEADLPAIVALLADDPLGAAREAPGLPLAPGYLAAFHAIAAAPNQRLVVAVLAERIVGTMQLAMLAGLSRQGSRHGIIEAVRIVADLRGQRLGERFVRWAIDECRAGGCTRIHLTSHGARTDAHRFWERMGFMRTHLGFGMDLAG